jgi:RHS repeat-associated protein
MACKDANRDMHQESFNRFWIARWPMQQWVQMFTNGWDVKNRLTSVAPITPTAGAEKDIFTYDGQDRRIGKDVYTWDAGSNAWAYSTTFRYVYDGCQIVAMLDGNDNILQAYAWGQNGTLLSITDFTGGTPQVYAVVTDAEGSVVSIANAATGLVAATYSYDVWGNPTLAQGLVALSPFRWQGELYDASFNRYYLDAREYSATARRFLSADPSGEQGDVNLYRPFGNDPVNNTDPRGTNYVGVADSQRVAVTRFGQTRSYALSDIMFNQPDVAAQLVLQAQMSQAQMTTALGNALGPVPDASYFIPSSINMDLISPMPVPETPAIAPAQSIGAIAPAAQQFSAWQDKRYGSDFFGKLVDWQLGRNIVTLNKDSGFQAALDTYNKDQRQRFWEEASYGYWMRIGDQLFRDAGDGLPTLVDALGALAGISGPANAGDTRETSGMTRPGGDRLIRSANGDVRFRSMIVQVQEDLTHLSSAQLEDMVERGTAGVTENGEVITLHHVNQNPGGPLWEIPAWLNDVNDKDLRPYGNAPGAGLTDEERMAFKEWRIGYWKARAREELARREFEQNGAGR